MKNGLWPNLFKGWDNKESETINTLKLIPVFKNFTKKEFLELEKLVHHRKFSENEFIFKNNAPGEGMYIIMKGSIKISIGDGKNEKILANLQEGDFFGELALFDDEPRSANAISLSESKLIGFFTPDLLALKDRNPVITNKILFNLGQILGERLRQTNSLLLDQQKK